MLPWNGPAPENLPGRLFPRLVLPFQLRGWRGEEVAGPQHLGDRPADLLKVGHDGGKVPERWLCFGEIVPAWRDCPYVL